MGRSAGLFSCSQRPTSSSLPPGLGLTPRPSGSRGHLEAEPARKSCPELGRWQGYREPVHRPVPRHRLGNQRGPFLPRGASGWDPVLGRQGEAVVHELHFPPCPCTSAPDPGAEDRSIAASAFSWQLLLQHQMEGYLGRNGGEDTCLGCSRPASGAHLPLPLPTCAERALARSLEFSIYRWLQDHNIFMDPGQGAE